MASFAGVFLLLFATAFAVLLFVLRSPTEERAIDRRLATLRLQTASDLEKVDKDLFKQKPSAERGRLAWENFGPVRALGRLAYQSTGTLSVRLTLSAIAFFGGAATATVFLLTGLAPIAGLAGMLFGALPVLRLYRMRQKRLRAFEAVLPDCIDTCARALRAGHSLVAAIGLIGEDAPEPARTEFAEIFRKQNYGLPLRDALMETLERVPSNDLRVLVTGILVQKDTGGNLTEVFDRIANVIRERMRIQGEIRVHTSQGRLTGWILSLLPVVLLLVINLINPGYSRPLFAEPGGRKLLYAGMILLIFGAALIRRIVNGIEV